MLGGSSRGKTFGFAREKIFTHQFALLHRRRTKKLSAEKARGIINLKIFYVQRARAKLHGANSSRRTIGAIQFRYTIRFPLIRSN